MIDGSMLLWSQTLFSLICLMFILVFISATSLHCCLTFGSTPFNCISIDFIKYSVLSSLNWSKNKFASSGSIRLPLELVHTLWIQTFGSKKFFLLIETELEDKRFHSNQMWLLSRRISEKYFLPRVELLIFEKGSLFDFSKSSYDSIFSQMKAFTNIPAYLSVRLMSKVEE